jgi:hypothetical protein
MVTALVVVAVSGFIIGTAHEKEVSAKLLKEKGFQSDIRVFGIYSYYSDVLSSDDSFSQKALVPTRNNLIGSLKVLEKLPQDHLYAKCLRANTGSIDQLVQGLEHKIAEYAVPSDGDKPQNWIRASIPLRMGSKFRLNSILLPHNKIPKQSALILAVGFIVGSVVICFGLVTLGTSIQSAGMAARPSHQMDVKIIGDSSGSAYPIVLRVKGESGADPIFIDDKSKN